MKPIKPLYRLGLMSLLTILLSLVTVNLFSPSSVQAQPPSIVCDEKNANTPGCTVSKPIYGIEMRALMQKMIASPAPNLTPIPLDKTELYQRAYRKVLKETPIYNAPNGGVVGNIDSGFNFVNAGREVDGFVEIRPNQWIPTSALGPVNKAISKFSGVVLPNGFPEIPFGWMIYDNIKPSKTPGAKPLKETKPLARYTMLNFFATVRLDGWDWYLIGPDQWVIQKHVAFPRPVKRPEGVTGKWFAIDLFEQTMQAYIDDTPVFATVISSGLPKFATNMGLFQIKERYKLIKMSGGAGADDFYYLPQVPYVMYFNDDEEAIHGAYWHDYFGWPRSHGCVNVSIMDAKWAYEWTEDAPHAFVYVYESEPAKAGSGTMR